MNQSLKNLFAPLASLRLTVVLLALSMLLIYAGTWAQIDAGIWQVQKQYFHSFLTWIRFQTFLPRPKPGEMPVPGGFPMLGGYALGLLLLINLIAAHLVRFKLTWKRCGVILTHLGLILLLVGEGVTSGFAQESQMLIDVGASSNYSADNRSVELAIVDPTPADHDDVAVIPGSRLKNGADIHHSALPIDIRIDQYFPNSQILGPMQAGAKADARATAGDGVGITVVDRPISSGVGSSASSIDIPSAYVTLSHDGQKLGTYLVSLFLDRPQQVKAGDKTLLVQLRFKRLYKPYTVHLIDFRHDVYPGTNTPRDFSSLVQLVDPTRGVDRQVRIWMNNPLRYNGETFYQSGFLPGDKATILQIVRNPAWIMPYVACAIGALGLVIHFGIKLVAFSRKQLNEASAPVRVTDSRGAAPGFAWRATGGALVAMLALYVCGLAYVLRPVGPKTSFDLATFGNLPILFDGRVQPLDSLARNSLKVINGREVAALKDEHIPAIRWLADIFARPEKADDYPVIRIDNKDILGLLNLDDSRKRFSLNELRASASKLQEQIDKVRKIPEEQRNNMDLFQRKIAELDEKLTIYLSLQQMDSLLLVPPAQAGGKWQTLDVTKQQPVASAAEGAGAVAGAGSANDQSFLKILAAYHDNDADAFNREVSTYAQQVQQKLPTEDKRVHFEADFNRIDLFTQSIVLYLTAFLFACVSWLFLGAPLRRAATVAVVIALIIHTAGLAARMYITQRPPVISNLASTAIFIGWGAVVLAVGIELFYRDGIGTIVAGMIGFCSLVIADRLSLSGDTMKVLQAVLDTNFWLATHVVVVTLGYAATFLAWGLGVTWVVNRWLGGTLDEDKDLIRKIYGIVCFAILFSFVGTILGGIWADQSWGRFWGWDPKENGAVLIVLANAILLHARWGGLARDRGIACLAIFGGIVTSWSWFGTNMLGVGLHSYGFMESALMWLLAFVISQIVLIAAAMLIPVPRRATQPA